MLDDILTSAKEPMLVRALAGNTKAAGPDGVTKFLRSVTLKASGC